MQNKTLIALIIIFVVLLFWWLFTYLSPSPSSPPSENSLGQNQENPDISSEATPDDANSPDSVRAPITEGEENWRANRRVEESFNEHPSDNEPVL